MAVPLTRDEKPQRVPIGGQIAEVRRELDKRREVFPRMVRDRKLRQSEADLFTNRMEAVLRTLEFVRDHEALIVSALKEQRETELNIETGGLT